ncbi:class I SAM-dependent methyltransferase [Chitinophaga defluvii]|uniref:Class I SAM-dependent methyltransferase n=1 Tax=Chitinophaga defluvii TaxID=3163343 RepID=A0ABV2TAT5_9BACT
MKSNFKKYEHTTTPTMHTNKAHWENVYHTRQPEEVSWTQATPHTSLDFIRAFNLPKTAAIIDIGGGDSKLADYLLEEGYENITVLDISAKALEKAQHRLGDKADKIKWIVQDITTFAPDTQYHLWHDRAAFHFLTAETQVHKYLHTMQQCIPSGGYAVMGTFATTGPEKCSGLPIQQYDENTLAQLLQNGFEKIKCMTTTHTTPFNTKQDFLFCSFRRKEA